MTAQVRTLSLAWALFGAVSCTGVIGAVPDNGAAWGDGGTGAPGFGGGGDGTEVPGQSGPGQSGGGEPGAGGAGAGMSGPGGLPRAFTCEANAAPDPGPTPLRLLSRTQYVNTLGALFGTLPDLTEALGSEAAGAERFGLVQPDVDGVRLGAYQAAAEVIAAGVVSDAAKLAKVAPCDEGADRRQCAESFVRRFGALAYRAPVTDAADVARHMALYDAGAKAGHEHGMELLLRGMLQAPRFLYRVELGTGETVGARAVKLSSHEIAARLAYVVWDAPPDAELTAKAESGALTTKEQVSSELERLLAHPKGAAFVRRFLEGLSKLPALRGVVKDAELYPEWSSAGSTLEASVEAQARAFFDDVLGAKGGSLDALLTSPTVFVNGDLAAYYGATTQGAALEPLTVADGGASGLLTLPALLSVMAKPDQSWPIYRGKFVREELFCQELPAPPPNIPKPPDVEPGVSTRERLSQHETNEACRNCHQLMDPIGFGFENYDGIGRYRTTDGDQAVDASGELTKTDVDGEFTGVVELARKLASSTEVRECIARQWFRYAIGRYEQSMDACSMRGVVDAFEAAGSSLNALPRAIVESDAFLYRRPIDPEVSP